jgi:hypothetical protein
MANTLPMRAESHQLEELSVRHFRQCLPRNWIAEKPGGDYGVDLRVDLFDGNRATGLELLVQIKSSAKPAHGGRDIESVRLKRSTYNYLRDKLQVVMLVKFVESENEAYWLLLKDVSPPSTASDTFTVKIPRTNRLSQAPWADVQDYVRRVTVMKLAANTPNAV